MINLKELDYIHKTFYANEFLYNPYSKAVFYLVRDENGKECRKLSVEDNSVRTIFKGNRTLKSIIVSSNGKMIAFNENRQLCICSLETGKICRYDYDIYPSKFYSDNKNLLGVYYKGSNSEIVKFGIDGDYYKVICRIPGYVGDPLQNFVYGGIRVSNNLILVEEHNQIIIYTNSYDMENAAIYYYDYSTNSLCKKIDICHSLILEEKCVFYKDYLYFKMHEDGIVNIYRINPNIKAPEKVTCFDNDVKDFIIVKDVCYAEVCEYSNMSTSIWKVNLRNEKHEKLLGSDGCHTPISVDEDVILYVYTNYYTPPELYSFSKGRALRRTYSSPMIVEQKFKNIRMKVCYSATGVLSKCYYQIEDDTKKPSIIWLHGGPQIYSLNNYIPFEMWLCSLGYTVYVPSYRGTLGLGHDWAMGALGECLGVTDLQDIQDVIDTGLDDSITDLSRIGVAGVSYGAYLALRCASQVKGISAAFAFGTITDWRIQQSLTDIRNYDYWLLKGWCFDKKIAEISPITEIDKVKIPVYLTHGKEDTDVPFLQIKEYKNVVDSKHKKNIMFHFYENEGHGLPGYKEEHFNHWHKLIRLFFAYYLKKWDYYNVPFSNQIYMGGDEYEDSFNPLDFKL